MIIHEGDLSISDGIARVRFPFVTQSGSSELWYEFDATYAQHVDPARCDAAVLALLPKAMRQGEDIEVRGPLSPKLFANLNMFVGDMLASFWSTNQIRVRADRMRIPDPGHGGVATGFSCGIDSLCAVKEFVQDPPHDSYRLTHLLFHNVGSHARGAERLWKERLTHVREAATHFDLPILAVNSNMDELIPFGFQETHTLRNTSVMMLFQGLISKLIYASTYQYRDISLSSTKDMAYIDPMLAPLLATEAFEVIPSGSQYSRPRKTELVAQLPESRKILDVCVLPDHAGNCSGCWKCLRTLITLDILGVVDEYASVFDLDKYHRLRKGYLIEVLASKGTFEREIRELAEERGYHISRSARFAAIFMPLFSKRMKQFVKRIVLRK